MQLKRNKQDAQRLLENTLAILVYFHAEVVLVVRVVGYRVGQVFFKAETTAAAQLHKTAKMVWMHEGPVTSAFVDFHAGRLADVHRTSSTERNSLKLI